MQRGGYRRSIRLSDYDYSRAGAHFVTLGSYRRQALFGSLVEARTELGDIDRIVPEEWLRTPAIRPEIELDAYVVMPNHLHTVVWIRESQRIAPGRAHGCTPFSVRV